MRSTPDDTRLPHAVLDLPSRRNKARKIEALLPPSDAGLSRRLRLLEVGAGSGGISHYFGTHPSGRFEVDAVDVVDSRTVTDGYRYTTVPGTVLPFADASFDIVISNHVIEHVGAASEQDRHLAELHRVLRQGGACYLAMPNRWMLVEPHYRLAFLSWWPESLRTRWLRLWRKGEHYDCRPLTRHGLQRAFGRAGFRFSQVHARAIHVMYGLEHPESLLYRRFLRHVPDSLYAMAGGIFPTLIYILRKPPA